MFGVGGCQRVQISSVPLFLSVLLTSSCPKSSLLDGTCTLFGSNPCYYPGAISVVLRCGRGEALCNLMLKSQCFSEPIFLGCDLPGCDLCVSWLPTP